MTATKSVAAGRAPARASPRRYDLLLLGVVAAGIAIRLAQFLQRRSLYIDEAMVVLSVASRSFAGLVQPLDYDQMAPVPFLWALRLATAIAGVSEQSLRFVPLLGGGALLVVMAVLARRLLQRDAALWVAVMAVLSPTLIYYSNEAKPYIFDALVAAVLLLLALDALEQRPGAWRRLVLGGAVGAWISAASCVVLAGVALALFPPAEPRRPAGWQRYLAACAVWGASFLAAYLLIYRRASTGQYMQRFWEDSYLRVGSLDGLSYSWALVVNAMWGLIVGAVRWDGGVPHPLAYTALGLGVSVLAVRGASMLIRRSGPRPALLLLGPLLALLAASAARTYPMASRLILVAAPSSLLLLGAGLGMGPPAWAMRRRYLMCGTVLGYAALTIPPDGRWALGPFQQSRTRQAIETFERTSRPDDPVYVFSRAVPAWAFYTTDWRHPDLARLATLHRWAHPGGAAFENSDTRGPRRAGDGAELVLHGRRDELMGSATGMQWANPSGFRRTTPDSGWAAAEAARIRAAARPGVWLLFVHYIDNAQVPLLGAVEAAGGRQVYRRQWPGALLYEYEFP